MGQYIAQEFEHDSSAGEVVDISLCAGCEDSERNGKGPLRSSYCAV